jgi:hypothetical protein
LYLRKINTSKNNKKETNYIPTRVYILFMTGMLFVATTFPNRPQIGQEIYMVDMSSA